MSHRSRIGQIELLPTPKDIIMFLAVAACGFKRARTELTLQRTPSATQVDVCSKYSIVT